MAVEVSAVSRRKGKLIQVPKITNDTPSVRIIGMLYECAEEVNRWPEMLAELARVTGGETVIVRFSTNHLIVGGAATEDDWLPELAVLSSDETMRMRLSKPDGTERDRLIGSAGDGIGLMIETRSPGSFSADAEDLVRGLLPHLACALRTRGSAQAEAVSMLDRAAFGTVVLDTAGAVRFINGRASDLLERGGLRIKDGALHGRSAIATAKLRGHVAMSASGTPYAESMPRTAAFSPLHIAIMPLRTGRASMLVTSPEDQSPIAPSLLQSLLGLTPAQARLTAAIVAGHSVRDAAARFGIVQPTAATHLKHILARTGVSSQAALVRLVLTGPLALLSGSSPGAEG